MGTGESTFTSSLQASRTLAALSLPVVAPTIGIVASEVLLAFGAIEHALWGLLATLLVCTLAPLRYERGGDVFLAFAILPVFRLVSLAMPQFLNGDLYWLLLVYGGFLPVAYLLARTSSTVSVSWKPKTAIVFLPVGMLLSLVLAEIEYLVLQPDPLISEWELGSVLVITIVMVGVVGLAEELIFRGVLQRALEGYIGRPLGLLLASLLFGMMHAGYGLHAQLAVAGGAGLLLGLIYDLTDSILLVAAIHGTLNVLLFAVFPIYGTFLRLSSIPYVPL